MSTNHHTPYPVGTELTAANMNIPLGQLDQALSDTLAGLKAFSAIHVGSGSPDASALLTMNSTTQGFLPPRMTSTQRDAIVSPATGLIIWNTSLTRLEYYNGITWAAFGETGGAMTEIIPTATLNASTGVSIQNIGGGFQDLLLRLKIRSNRAAATDTLNLKFNNLSGNYAWTQFRAASSLLNANSSSDAAIDIICPAASALANSYLDISFWIQNYSMPTLSTSIRRSGWYRGSLSDATLLYSTWGAFEWAASQPINRIDFDVEVGTAFSGNYALYGLGTAASS